MSEPFDTANRLAAERVGSFAKAVELADKNNAAAREEALASRLAEVVKQRDHALTTLGEMSESYVRDTKSMRTSLAEAERRAERAEAQAEGVLDALKLAISRLDGHEGEEANGDLRAVVMACGLYKRALSPRHQSAEGAEGEGT